MNFRNILAVLFLFFLLAWFGLLYILVTYSNIGVLTALGLGTASGVFLKSFSDMWQFYFRRVPEKEK